MPIRDALRGRLAARPEPRRRKLIETFEAEMRRRSAGAVVVNGLMDRQMTVVVAVPEAIELWHLASVFSPHPDRTVTIRWHELESVGVETVSNGLADLDALVLRRAGATFRIVLSPPGKSGGFVDPRPAAAALSALQARAVV